VAAARLAAAAAIVAVLAAAWGGLPVPYAAALAPAAAFVALAVYHARVIERRGRAERAVRFHDDALARLDGRAPERDRAAAGPAVDENHPYAADLDLFGPDSVFARLDTARTRPGRATLSAWLLAPATPEAVRARQEAVRELAPALDLREDLAVLGGALGDEADTDRLLRWAASRDRPGPAWLRPAAGALAAVSVSALVAWGAGAVGPWPFLAALVVQSVAIAPFRRGIARALAQAHDPERDLELLSGVLDRFERENFAAPALVALRARLESGGAPPSLRVRGLARRLDLADARRNQMFLPLSLIVLWGTQCAFALTRWRDRHGAAVRDWIEAVGELEALAALSGWAYERPDDAFPEILDPASGPVFDAVGLGHPLIPAERRVRNDVALGGEVALLVVSGSNMSGKSTLLRTVGVNVVLALAGAPACARSLRLTPLDVGATLRVQDSLQAGESRFYAEISRLAAILERADGTARGGSAVLFLLDEILAGTNSHDRAIGAEAIVRGLLARRAIGMITTHDLALAALAERLAPAAANVHFEDRLEDGRMVFDYRMRPGVVRRSNALALMRSIGLDV